MDEFYFLGSLAQYWQAVYAEYVRLSALLGEEPFSITASSGLTLPLSEYKPTELDMVLIQFADKELREIKREKSGQPLLLKYYGKCMVSVKATAVVGAEQVILDVDIYSDVVKKSDGVVFARWLQIQNDWLAKGWLVNPRELLAKLAQLDIKIEKPPKPKSKSDRAAWFVYYELMNKRGYKYTLKQLAKELNITEGHAKRLHADFSKQSEVG
jgi:hypothetical protein